MVSGQLQGQTYHLPIRVYYEDTDQQGIVFYANYLKFFERGRTEFLRHLGAPPGQVEIDHDRLFVVAKVELSYHQSAKLDDLLDVRTRVGKLGRVKLVMHQEVWCQDRRLVSGTLTIGIIDRDGRPAKLPAEVEAKFVSVAN